MLTVFSWIGYSDFLGATTSTRGGRIFSIRSPINPRPWWNISWEPSSLLLPDLSVDPLSSFFESIFPNFRSNKFWPIILSSSSYFFGWMFSSSLFFLSSTSFAFSLTSAPNFKSILSSIEDLLRSNFLFFFSFSSPWIILCKMSSPSPSAFLLSSYFGITMDGVWVWPGFSLLPSRLFIKLLPLNKPESAYPLGFWEGILSRLCLLFIYLPIDSKTSFALFLLGIVMAPSPSLTYGNFTISVAILSAASRIPWAH